ncbi:MAG: hypothetical protein NTV02_03420 [Candidatus Zambryskibacteria bacterium]|nr:hypothetical protein [Candidatus Zambryskibacteria bacterium]
MKLKIQKKMGTARKNGYWDVRVSHKESKGKKSPSYTFKCGCCSKKVEIYYDEEDLEINGVIGSIENWRELLLPLLRVKNTKRIEK